MHLNRRFGVTLAASAAFLAAAAVPAHADGVSPGSVDQSINPGDTVHVTKTVSTPVIPPKPDIVLVIDRTGSMGPYLNNVKAQIADVVNTVKTSQPDAQFAVTSYCDTGFPPVFQLNGALSGNLSTITAAVNSVALCDGGDTPEAQLNALWQIGSGGNAIGYRSGSSRIVAWFGDQPGHDPSEGHSLSAAIASLQGVGAKVVAVSVGANQLDSGGQATAITNATGGTLLSGVPASQVAAKIIEGLTSLPVTVAGNPTCDPGLSVTLTPSSQTVTSGTDAVFDEAITLAPDAPQGSTLHCTTPFTLNGLDAGPGFTQSIAIHVNDVTAPAVSCPEGPNPAGKIPSSHNQDGFYRMLASDNVDPAVSVTVKDLGSGQTFGPYASGTTFKLTQAPGAKPAVAPFQGAVDWRFKLKGDAQLVATDAAGNTTTATCEVPPS
jgi:hypothetical protein